MKRRHGLLAVLALPLALGTAEAQPQSDRPPVGELKSLGGERYQIGRIVIDKAAHRFTVPGRVHALGQPLEYLATAPGGMKAYETLFEVDATGSEFNLACILIGLERDPKDAIANRMRRGPLIGPRVAIFVAWSDGGKRHQLPAAEAIHNSDSGVKPESVEWVYTGAPANDLQGRFPADVTGTLVGFKSDENNVIESAVGIGIGAYGSVRGNEMLPPKGSPIELIVELPRTAK